MQLKAIKKVKAYELVAEALKEYIATNGLKPDDQLPSEQELANIFNVGRSSVREGIRYLQTLGLVESRTKKGLIVKKANLDAVKEYIQFQLLNNGISHDKLFEAARVIYLGIIPIIINKITPSHIATLSNIITKQEGNIENGELFAKYDYLFHETLNDISNNEVIQQYADLLKQSFDSKTAVFTTEIALATIQMHKDILEQLKKRDLFNTLEAMLKHNNYLIVSGLI